MTVSFFLLSAVIVCRGYVDELPVSVFWKSLRNTYLEVLKNALTGDLIETSSVEPALRMNIKEYAYDKEKRAVGLDWPRFGYTMIGKRRLDMLHEALVSVVEKQIVGDFVECGVWRGGASIFARMVFNSYRDSSRKVYVVDSFSGLPPSKHAVDRTKSWDKTPFLEVSLEHVQRHFRHFGDEALQNTVFVKGFFNDTLPQLRNSIDSLAILRLDGDMYESCADIMGNLYAKVSVGGYVIVDDWFTFPCKDAIESFMKFYNIEETFIPIDQYGAYFVKSREFAIDDKWYNKFLTEKKSH